MPCRPTCVVDLWSEHQIPHSEGEFDIGGRSEDGGAVKAAVVVARYSLVPGERVPNLDYCAGVTEYGCLRSQPDPHMPCDIPLQQ